MKITSFTDTLSAWLITATIFLLPIFFLPLKFDMFEFPKYILLLTSTLLLLSFWAIKTIFNGVKITIPSLAFPLFLLTASFSLSLIFISINKIQPLISPGSTGTIITLFLWYLLLSFHLQEQQHLSGLSLLMLTLSLSLLSLIGMISFTGITKVIGTSVPEWLKSTTFSPAGTPFNLFTLLLSGIIISGAATFLTNKDDLSSSAGTDKSEATSYLYPIAAGIILIGAVISAYQIITSQKPLSLPLETGWSIAVEGLKQPKTAFLGIGPDNFITAFTLRKPLKFNKTPLWNTRFAVSSNYYLQLLTSVGIMGLASFVLILYQASKYGLKQWEILDRSAKVALLGLLSIFTIYLFVPGNTALLFLLFTLAALLSAGNACLSVDIHAANNQRDLSPSISSTQATIATNSLAARAVIAILIGIAVPTISYLAARSVAAEYRFSQALTAIENNQAQKAYQANKQAINLNPFIDRYYLTYSQINQAIAASLAKNAKNVLGVEENQPEKTIAQLAQQAIRAGKNAVALNPTKASNWENLALIYRQLVPAVAEAEQWTIKAYQQAIKIDPTNPDLRLKLGGFYYSQEMFDEAIDQFKSAIALKPDFINAHYNLSHAYEKKGDFQKAYNEMQTVVNYLSKSKDDEQWEKAKSELVQLEKKAKIGNNDK